MPFLRGRRGGYIFGKLGIGRTRTLGISIIWFSAFTGLTWFAASPEQLFVMRFLACLGIGGTWPNGVALVSEVWATTARPVLASAIGMAGNLGIFTMSNLSRIFAENEISWKMGLLANTAPILLGALILALLPESPSWQLNTPAQKEKKPSVFRKPHLKVTLIGIALATIPLIGGWGSANWMVPWAADEGKAIGDGTLAPRVVMYRSLASIVGSLLAGLIASRSDDAGPSSRLWRPSCRHNSPGSFPHDKAFFILAVWASLRDLLRVAAFSCPNSFPPRPRYRDRGKLQLRPNPDRTLHIWHRLRPRILQPRLCRDRQDHRFVFLLGVVAIYFAPDTSKRNMAE